MKGANPLDQRPSHAAMVRIDGKAKHHPGGLLGGVDAQGIGDRKDAADDLCSVVGGKASLWSGHSLSAVLQPGDTVVVPEKAVGGGIQWQTVFLATQVASSVASTVFIALRY